MSINRTITRRFFEGTQRRRQVRRVTPIEGAGLGRMVVRVDGCDADNVVDSIGSPKCGEGALQIRDGFQAAVVASPVGRGPRSSSTVALNGSPFSAPQQIPTYRVLALDGGSELYSMILDQNATPLSLERQRGDLIEGQSRLYSWPAADAWVIQADFRQKIKVWRPSDDQVATATRQQPPSDPAGLSPSMSEPCFAADGSLYWAEMAFTNGPPNTHRLIFRRINPASLAVTTAGQSANFDNSAVFSDIDAESPTIKENVFGQSVWVNTPGGGGPLELGAELLVEYLRPGSRADVIQYRDMSLSGGGTTSIIEVNAVGPFGRFTASTDGLGTYFSSANVQAPAEPVSMCVQALADGTFSDVWPNSGATQHWDITGTPRAMLSSSIDAFGDYNAFRIDTADPAGTDGAGGLTIGPPVAEPAITEVDWGSLRDLAPGATGNLFAVAAWRIAAP